MDMITEEHDIEICSTTPINKIFLVCCDSKILGGEIEQQATLYIILSEGHILLFLSIWTDYFLVIYNIEM